MIEFYQKFFLNNAYWFRLALKWFFGAAIVGIATFFLNPGLLKTILEALQERFGINPELNFELAVQIFLQNVLVSALALFGGLIFGIGSVLVLFINGFLLGYILASLFFLQEFPYQSLSLIIGGILPHGILEIPAFLIAASLGLRLGLEWIKKDSFGRRWQIFKGNFIHAVINFPLIVLLLLLAAIIEVFISGRLVNNF